MWVQPYCVFCLVAWCIGLCDCGLVAAVVGGLCLCVGCDIGFVRLLLVFVDGILVWLVCELWGIVLYRYYGFQVAIGWIC